MTKLTPAKDVPVYALIIRATHERDAIQHEAIYELNARGGWLSDDQKTQAGLSKEEYYFLCHNPPKSTPIRESHIEKLLTRLNGSRGKSYPMLGYIYWADIKGDGVHRPSLWQIINPNGGVGCARELLGRTRRETCAKLARLIAQEQVAR